MLGGLMSPSFFGGIASAATPQPTMQYTFDGNLTDSKGNSTLTTADACPADPCNATAEFGSDADGKFWRWTSTTEHGGGFTINTNENLGATYTIALKFAFDNESGWRKIIDYKNRASDNGFYFNDSTLNFYPFDEYSPESYPEGSVLDLIAVRQATDATNGTFTVYAVGADGQLKHLFTSQDSSSESIPATNPSGGTTLGFFFDDTDTYNEATSGGRVYGLRMWPGAALSEDEVQSATSPPAVPTDVTATAGDGSATVSWTGSSDATTYTVTAEPGGATCTATAPATSCVISGLTNGTAYTFTVVATGDGGNSDRSQPSAAVTPAAPATTTTSVTTPTTTPVPQVTTTTTQGGNSAGPAGTTGPRGDSADPASNGTTGTGSGTGSGTTVSGGTLPRTGESSTRPLSTAGATLALLGMAFVVTFRRERPEERA
jgi:LPXTG-motif cell wall-anchored protein